LILQRIVSVLLFYADAQPPAGLFDPFLDAAGPAGQVIVSGKMSDILATTAVSPVDHNRCAKLPTFAAVTESEPLQCGIPVDHVS